MSNAPATGEPATVRVDLDRLDLLRARIAGDVERGACDGAVYVVAHRGEVVAHEAVGWADRAAGRAARADDVFCLHSIAKPIVACLLARCVDDGLLELTTPVADVIPELAGSGRERITLDHLLTHRSGLSERAPFPDWERNADVAQVVAWVARSDRPRWRPGERVCYSSLVGHAVAAEVARRADGRGLTISQLLRERVLAPCGMDETAPRKEATVRERWVPQRVLEPLGNFPTAVVESFDAAAERDDFEVPGAGMWGTARDVARFAEAMRREGSGARGRIVSPAMARLAVRNRTGDQPDDFQALQADASPFPLAPPGFALSFKTRGTDPGQHPYGSLVSPRTYGALGLGSTMVWVDPDSELSFSILTAGLVEEIRSARRFARLSNVVASSLVPTA